MHAHGSRFWGRQGLVSSMHSVYLRDNKLPWTKNQFSYSKGDLQLPLLLYIMNCTFNPYWLVLLNFILKMTSSNKSPQETILRGPNSCQSSSSVSDSFYFDIAPSIVWSNPRSLLVKWIQIRNPLKPYSVQLSVRYGLAISI